MLIGIDLDNTIIDYDAGFSRLGQRLGLLPEGFAGSKRDVRNHLWREGGDLPWQRLQAAVYGSGIAEAVPSPGVLGFMSRAVAAGHSLAIVSHKTQFAAADPAGTDLRASALGWLSKHRVTSTLIKTEAIHFENSRDAKIVRIAALGCRYFIDDLEEVLLDPTFPTATEGVHFARGPTPSHGGGVLRAFSDWAGIEGFILGEGRRSSP